MLNETIAAIQPLDINAMTACQLRLDNLTKPLGSLHGLELLAGKMAGITRLPRPQHIQKSIILMAADHGVAKEGVSAYPQEVTRQMVYNFSKGGAAINVLARHAGAELVLVDIGVVEDLPVLPGLRQEKVSFGTKNMAEGPAMTMPETIRAIEIGIQVAMEQTKKGVNVIGLGDMGIGNTTPSTAIIAAFVGQVDKLVGRGTGISEKSLQRKIEVIERALTVNKPQRANPLDVLAKVGGLEIAGLVGVILGAAAGRAAVVLDGVITGAAALIAVKLAPQTKDYLVGSHFSPEPAHRMALELIDLPAYLHMNMRLGEGTGAALGLTLIDAALTVLNDMKTFGEAAVAVAEDGLGAGKQHLEVK
jgi:nicotinate-nucleotide--dimethylbenzimidazole phosphoribosyltransferase